MRIAFLLVALAGALFYTYGAFADLGFMTRTGRLGPGFFPRVIGLLLVAFIVWAVVDALRARGASKDTAPGHWTDVAALIALAVGYAVLLRLLGGLIATVIFLVLALSLLNRGKPMQNVMLSVLLPVGIYLLFDRILNASMPPGLINLPI